jgi:tetratricopeptide (TPR) repeat protein
MDIRIVNPEAHEAYLKGRYNWHQRTEEGIFKAIDYFQQAIEIDPEYALAYTGLADCYIVAPGFFLLLPNEVYPKAETAALKALEIDENLAEAYVSLGAINHQYRWDRSEAENLYKKAISINPNYATAHQWYGELLLALGRYDDALVELNKAQELDPFKPVINMLQGRIYFFMRDYDEAIVKYKAAIELHPNFQPNYLFLSRIYSQANMHEEAIETAKKAINLSANLWAISRLGYTYGKAGDIVKAQEQLKIINTFSNQQLILNAGSIAELYVGLGDYKKVFEWLEIAYENIDYSIMYLKVTPCYDSIRSDPRYLSLLKKIGFSE